MEPETRRARGQAAGALATAVNAAGEYLLGQAVARAPVEEGTLRGSAQLVLIVNGERHSGLGSAKAAAIAAAESGQRVTVTAEVSFNTVYAARQHEETSWQHPKGGQAKYLSQPLAEAGPRLTNFIRAAAG